MFSRWGAFVYRFRRPVVLIAVVLAIASSVLATQTSSALSAGGWLDANSESASRLGPSRHRVRGGQELGHRALPITTPGADATSAEFQAAIATSIAGPVRSARGHGRRGLRRDRRQALHQHRRRRGLRRHPARRHRRGVGRRSSTRSARRSSPPAATPSQLTGYGPITKDSAEQSEKDLQKAEVVSLPVVALVLILVFASLVAAGMPLLVAGLAIPSSLALIYLVAQQVEMSIFVLNIATMLGLALAIDYSLFIVSRFREELRRGRTVGDAVERAVATAGKAVAFSGIAVAIGLSGLLLFEAPAIRSIGIAGALVVLCSVVFALTFLPAVLGMLGHRVNSLSIRGPSPPLPPGRRRRRGRPDRRAGSASRTPSCAARSPSSSRPSPSCSSSAARSCGSSRACRAPRSTRPASRAATRTSRSRPSSRPGETTPIIILADVTGLPDRPRQHPGARRLRRRASTALANIDRVESPFTIHDPRPGRS